MDEELNMFRRGFISAVAAGALICTTLLVGNVAIATASSTPGGLIKIFSDQSNDTNNGATGPIVITGAIGDYGTATTINKDGTVNSSGNYVKIVLKKGTFEINSIAFNKATNSAQPTSNAANCSNVVIATGPVTLFDGTGAYAGIGGTLTITLNVAYIAPKTANGKCNENTQPADFFATITGSGVVSF